MTYQIKSKVYLDGICVGSRISAEEYNYEEANALALHRTFIKENVMVKSEVIISQNMIITKKEA